MVEKWRFKGKEIEEELRKMPDRDVRRILRVASRFCVKNGGTPVMYKTAREVEMACYFDEPVSFFIGSFYGVVDMGHVRLVTPADISEFKVPEGWHVDVGDYEEKVYGFSVKLTYTPELGVWTIRVGALKRKPVSLD